MTSRRPPNVREMSKGSVDSSQPGVEKNCDGSVDVYFGPEAPAGKESNRIPTQAGRRFFRLFRFYAPESAVFDGSSSSTTRPLEEVGPIGDGSAPPASASRKASPSSCERCPLVVHPVHPDTDGSLIDIHEKQDTGRIIPINCGRLAYRREFPCLGL